MKGWIVGLILVVAAIAVYASTVFQSPLEQWQGQCKDCTWLCSPSTGERTCGSSCEGNTNYVKKMAAKGWEPCSQEKLVEQEGSPVMDKPSESKSDAQPIAPSDALPSKFCDSASDCGLLMCAGCYSTSFIQTAPPDLPCATYYNYSCACIRHQCTPVKPI